MTIQVVGGGMDKFMEDKSIDMEDKSISSESPQSVISQTLGSYLGKYCYMFTLPLCILFSRYLLFDHVGGGMLG